MKRIKAFLNLIILLTIIIINIWVFNIESNYSEKKVSKKLEKTKKQSPKINVEYLVCTPDLEWEKYSITLKIKKLTLTNFQDIFKEIVKKQFSIFPFIPPDIKIKGIFKTENGIIVNIVNFNPNDGCILDSYLLKNLISENIFFIYKKENVIFIFNNGLKNIKSEFLFNHEI